MSMDGTLHMTRHLPRDPETVFRFLTQGVHLLEWWGPEGTTIAENNLDFSRPGPWFAVMVGPSGDGARVVGDVRRVDPPLCVTFTLAFDMGEAGLGPTSEITFTLATAPDGTRLDLVQTGLDPAHIDDMMNKGWNSALARLAQLIATA